MIDKSPRKIFTVLFAATAWPLLTASSCATTPEPRIEVRTVNVPVAVKCGTDPGPRPAYADTDTALRAAADIFESVKLLLAGRAQRMAREAELEAAGAGCR